MVKLNKMGRNNIFTLLSRAMDPADNLSSKRLTLLASLAYFFFSSFLFTVIGVIVVFVAGKGDMAQIAIFSKLITNILEKNFYIILAALGFISVMDVGKAVIEKAKVTLPTINVAEGAESPTIVQNAENISPANNVTAQNVQTVNTTGNVTAKKDVSMDDNADINKIDKKEDL